MAPKRSVRIEIRIDKQTNERLKNLAKTTGKSLSQLINEAIEIMLVFTVVSISDDDSKNNKKAPNQ